MRRRFWTCTVLLWACVAPSIAQAYEDQITLSAGAGYAYAGSDALPRHGALVDLALGVGLGRALTLRGRGSYALHPDDEPLHALWLGGELLYVVDVLQWVPYVGGGTGGLARLRGDANPELDSEVHLTVGVDCLLSRTLALELEVRPYLLVSELNGDPFYLAVAAAVVWFFEG